MVFLRLNGFFFFNIYNYCHILFSESEEPNYDNEFMGRTGKLLYIWLSLFFFTVKWIYQIFVNINLPDETNLKSQKRSTMKSIIKFAHVILICKGLWFKSEFSV